MGDDHKITKVYADQTIVPEEEIKEIKKSQKEEKSKTTKTSVQLFLKKELSALKVKSTQDYYHLDEEFSKTRKNRSYFVPVVLLLCTLSVVGLVVGIYEYLVLHPYEIDINSGLLEEISPEALADEVTRTTVFYENSLSNIQSLKDSHEEKLLAVKKQYEFDLYVIDSMNIDDSKDVKKRKEAAKNEYKKNVDSVNAEMKEKIDAAKKESESYKKRLEIYEKQDRLNNLNNTDQQSSEEILRRLEREKLIRDYEERLLSARKELEEVRREALVDKEKSIMELSKKYQDEVAGLDPELSDQKARSIIQDSESIKTSSFSIGKFTDKAEKVRDTRFRIVLKNAQEWLKNYEYLHETVKSLPQKHSIPDYVQTENKLVVYSANQIVETAVESLNNLSDDLQNEKDENELLQRTLLSILETNNRKALVMESTDDKLRIFALGDVIRECQKNDVEAHVNFNGKEVFGKLNYKSGKIYFVPDFVDLSEEVKELHTLPQGTFVILTSED